MEDIIRREDAIKAVGEHLSFDASLKNKYEHYEYFRNVARHILQNVPSVEPMPKYIDNILVAAHYTNGMVAMNKESYQRLLKETEPKRGHWIELEGPRIQCSACKRKIVWTGHGILKHPRFCPNCGSDMRGER